MPTEFNEPDQKVETLKEIWCGKELQSVRKHFENKVDDVDVCKNCTFKDTYNWENKLSLFII